MYIVNAGSGFKKMLWPAAQKFIDPKTVAKIQVKDTTIQLVYFTRSFPAMPLILHSFAKFSDS